MAINDCYKQQTGQFITSTYGGGGGNQFSSF